MNEEYKLPPGLELIAKNATLAGLVSTADKQSELLQTTLELIKTITSEIEQINEQIDNGPPDRDTAAPNSFSDSPTLTELQPASPEDPK